MIDWIIAHPDTALFLAVLVGAISGGLISGLKELVKKRRRDRSAP